MIEYYGNIVLHANERMENSTEFFSTEDEEEDYDEDETEEIEMEEVMKILEEKKKAKLH